MFTSQQMFAVPQPGVTGNLRVPSSELMKLVDTIKGLSLSSQLMLADALGRPAEATSQQNYPVPPQIMQPAYQQPMVPQAMNMYVPPVAPVAQQPLFTVTKVNLPDLTQVKMYAYNVLQDILNVVNSSLASYNIPITSGVLDAFLAQQNMLLELSPNVQLLMNQATGRPNIHFNLNPNKAVDPNNAPYVIDALTNLVMFIHFFYSNFIEKPFHSNLKFKLNKTDILVEVQSQQGNIELSVGHLLLIKYKVDTLGNNMYKTLKIAGYDVKIDRMNFAILDRKTQVGPVFSNEILNNPIANTITLDDTIYKKYLSNPEGLTILALVFLYNNIVSNSGSTYNNLHSFQLKKSALKYIDVYAKTDLATSVLFENIE